MEFLDGRKGEWDGDLRLREIVVYTQGNGYAYLRSGGIGMIVIKVIYPVTDFLMIIVIDNF